MMKNAFTFVKEKDNMYHKISEKNNIYHKISERHQNKRQGLIFEIILL